MSEGLQVFELVEVRLREAVKTLDEAVARAMFPEYFPPAPGERRYSYLELLSAAVPVDPDDGRTYEERLNDLPSVRARYE